MLITDEIEKLVMFKFRTGKTWEIIAQELDITNVYLSYIIYHKKNLSNQLYKKIEQLFQREQFTEALSDEGKL